VNSTDAEFPVLRTRASWLLHSTFSIGTVELATTWIDSSRSGCLRSISLRSA